MKKIVFNNASVLPFFENYGLGYGEAYDSLMNLHDGMIHSLTPSVIGTLSTCHVGDKIFRDMLKTMFHLLPDEYQELIIGAVAGHYMCGLHMVDTGNEDIDVVINYLYKVIEEEEKKRTKSDR